ncbi:MAG TPA: hypothetical protein DCS89_13390, partial [Gammaproteobacteria bacterium]|nr:hypothetical protein [Gammaproteobacteria bacterium]
GGPRLHTAEFVGYLIELRRAMIKEWLRPRILGAISVLFYTLLISACSPSEPSFHESETPLRLSAWKLLTID